MSYLHCHSKGCGWSQDDFWDINGYTPFREDLINDLKKYLFQDKVYMDEWFFKENLELPYCHDDGGFYCKGTELVTWMLKQKARSIENMLVKTFDEFKEKRESLVCPKCGKQNWDID